MDGPLLENPSECDIEPQGSIELVALRGRFIFDIQFKRPEIEVQ
jgi:hypothetical protein